MSDPTMKKLTIDDLGPALLIFILLLAIATYIAAVISTKNLNKAAQKACEPFSVIQTKEEVDFPDIWHGNAIVFCMTAESTVRMVNVRY